MRMALLTCCIDDALTKQTAEVIGSRPVVAQLPKYASKVYSDPILDNVNAQERNCST